MKRKVLDDGFYCFKCDIFIDREQMGDWECYCGAEKWKKAEKVLEIKEE